MLYKNNMSCDYLASGFFKNVYDTNWLKLAWVTEMTTKWFIVMESPYLQTWKLTCFAELNTSPIFVTS